MAKRSQRKPTPEAVKGEADRAAGQRWEPSKGGRRSKYQPGFAKQTEKLCKLGATDQEIADFFEVRVSTIGNWKNDYPEFLEALKTGKAEPDERVTRSLYHKAIGYSYDAVKIFMPAGATEPVYAPYREHVPPDTTACIFWLKNRRQQEWRDVHKHEHGQPQDFDNMPLPEFRAELERTAAACGIERSAIAHLLDGPLSGGETEH